MIASTVWVVHSRGPPPPALCHQLAADDDSRTGLDGEAVPSGAIQAEIFPGALRVFCAAPLAAARTAVSPPERAA